MFLFQGLLALVVCIAASNARLERRLQLESGSPKALSSIQSNGTETHILMRRESIIRAARSAYKAAAKLPEDTPEAHKEMARASKKMATMHGQQLTPSHRSHALPDTVKKHEDARANFKRAAAHHKSQANALSVINASSDRPDKMKKVAEYFQKRGQHHAWMASLPETHPEKKEDHALRAVTYQKLAVAYPKHAEAPGEVPLIALEQRKPITPYKYGKAGARIHW